MPGWDFWITFALLAMGAGALMAHGVTLWRDRAGLARALPACLASLFLCAAVSAGFYMAHERARDLAQAAGKRPVPLPLAADWGKHLSPEERSYRSQESARFAFIETGVELEVFDSAGDLRRFEPSESDHRHRQAVLREISLNERASSVFFWAGVCWLLLPFAGIALGYASWWSHLVRRVDRR
jgi:hypothetical protein